MTTPTPVPGWYADPQGQAELRYWDGNTWTSHTSGAALGGSDAPAPTASPTDAWGRSSAIVPGYGGGDPFSTASAASSRGGMPWWAWVAIAAGVLVLVLLVVLGLQAATQTASPSGDQDDPEQAQAIDSEPDSDDAAVEGVDTYVTPQRLASFEIQPSWRDDMETVLEFTPTLRPDLAGSWNLDGRSFQLTRHFMYVWEYADMADEGMTVAETGEEYYSNLLFYEDIEVITRETDTFVTSQGYDVWVEEMTFIDSDGITLDTYLAVTSNGTDWLAFDIMMSSGDGDDTGVADMVDSVIFLRD